MANISLGPILSMTLELIEEKCDAPQVSEGRCAGTLALPRSRDLLHSYPHPRIAATCDSTPLSGG